MEWNALTVFSNLTNDRSCVPMFKRKIMLLEILDIRGLCVVETIIVCKQIRHKTQTLGIMKLGKGVTVKVTRCSGYEAPRLERQKTKTKKKL